MLSGTVSRSLPISETRVLRWTDWNPPHRQLQSELRESLSQMGLGWALRESGGVTGSGRGETRRVRGSPVGEVSEGKESTWGGQVFCCVGLQWGS